MTAQLILGDCLEEMPKLADASFDAIICDLPYGTTALKWDTVIPFAPMWAQLKRLAKLSAAIVLFGSQPFTSALVASNFDMFKYGWVWRKSKGAGFLTAKLMPIKIHEDISVFSNGKTSNGNTNNMNYYPQGLKPVHRIRKNYNAGTVGYRPCRDGDYTQTQEGYPTTVLEFPNDGDALHPTQKPVALLEYLVRTYTNEGDTVLDFTMGSGTTGVACKKLNRNFVGIEKDPAYFEIAKRRIEETQVGLI